MTLLILGIIVSAFTGKLRIVAPAVNLHPSQAPPMWPFLFVTIACGAISGFHSLVSSGTSSKQVKNEADSLFVGYGSMLMEGALATLVVVAVAAGIGNQFYKNLRRRVRRGELGRGRDPAERLSQFAQRVQPKGAVRPF